MAVSIMNFFERVLQTRESQSANGRSHFENGRGRASNKKQLEKHSDVNPEPQANPPELDPRYFLDRRPWILAIFLSKGPVNATAAGLSEPISWPVYEV